LEKSRGRISADAGSRKYGFISDFFAARSVAALWHPLARRDATHKSGVAADAGD